MDRPSAERLVLAVSVGGSTTSGSQYILLVYSSSQEELILGRKTRTKEAREETYRKPIANRQGRVYKGLNILIENEDESAISG